jgi:hypothetical protein
MIFLSTKLSKFFRLNLIAFKLYNNYKLNIYLSIFLMFTIISSIIMRSNILYLLIGNNYFNLIVQLLVILSTIYSLKLIFDIMNRGIQAFRIIPEFIKLYKSNTAHIKSIISLYYIQNMLFMLLSL